MPLHSSRFAYSDTGYFSSMVSAYLDGSGELRSFYNHPVSVDGIKAAIGDRKAYDTNRALLIKVLAEQYKNIQLTQKQQQHLQLLNNGNTFTVCTAHQPNIFTGHLYFIYKILHAIKLANTLTSAIPGNHFVPVYYMGSEDADLPELNHIYLGNEKYEWKTNQAGAVGRMKVDEALLQVIDVVSGQLSVQQFGEEIISLMRSCYRLGSTIEQATFQFVNALFAEYGLIILLPDNRLLKEAFIPVIQKELAEGFSHKAVQETVALLPPAYKAQAAGRETNLFYLTDDGRERIEKRNGEWSIVNSEKVFSEKEILHELNEYPGRFSANVILRPLFQEMILPNVAFIGGGGELAYWLELKKVFEAAAIPYPVLVLRNSFLIIEKRNANLLDKLQFSAKDLFRGEAALMKTLTKRDSQVQLDLDLQKNRLKQLYTEIKEISGKTDATLRDHTEALYVRTLKKIEALETKMLRAEKRKFEAQHRQLQKLLQQLFPGKSLQERKENFMSYYAKWGRSFFDAIYDNSLSLEQEFVILTED